MGKMVKCIWNNAFGDKHLEQGKVYEVAMEFTDLYRLKNVEGDWDKRRFEGVPSEVTSNVEDDRNTIKHNKYHREIKPGIFVDVYDVLRAFNVTDPCLQHLLKKALASGQRGHKDLKEDLDDILASAKRAVDMHKEWADKT